MDFGPPWWRVFWTSRLKKSMRGFIQFDGSTIKSVPRKPGIYLVCLKNPFPRLSGKETNIVYIGKASGVRHGLRGRTASFFRISGSGRNAIGRFRGLSRKKGEEFLYYYRECVEGESAREAEAREFAKYKDELWELPPLNHSE